MNWPNHYPDDCPPASASDAVGTSVYRLVAGRVPTDEDFKSYFDLGKAGPECERRGLSVAMAPDPLRRLRRVVPAKRHHSICKLQCHDGKLAQTGAKVTHYTWWIPNPGRVDIAVHCVVLEESEA